MSADVVARIGALATRAALDAAWAQWSALTSAAAPARGAAAGSIVDPEALVLVSLALRERERRLDDLLFGWASSGSTLLSVQRLKTLAAHFPRVARAAIPEFAAWAADAGDRRWRSYATTGDTPPGVQPRRKDLGPLRLLDRPALMLRLRAGFGVGAKADVLAVLLGMEGAAADLKTIALATGFSGRAIRTAAEEMRLAAFIHERGGTPSAYRADAQTWGAVLATGPRAARAAAGAWMPRWGFWWIAYAFLAAVIEWERQGRAEGWSAYVAGSRGRDLVEEHRKRLWRLDVHPTEVREAAGGEFLETLEGLLERTAAWTRAAV
jgi:hypothetical protein